MIKKQNMSVAISAIIVLILAACGNGAEESNTKPEPQPSKSKQAQHADKGATEKPEGSKDKLENDTMNEKYTKGSYLRKLNEMEEADRNAKAKITMKEMEEQESERYQKWDKELNKIYSVLKKELDPARMEKLRVEQRNWVKNRDVAAKKSSLKYKGGSTETLEYVATQATLTKERCYELAARYLR